MLVPKVLYMALGSTDHGESFDHSFGFIMHGCFPFHWIPSVQLKLITSIAKMTHQTCLKGKTAANAQIPHYKGEGPLISRCTTLWGG